MEEGSAHRASNDIDAMYEIVRYNLKMHVGGCVIAVLMVSIQKYCLSQRLKKNIKRENKNPRLLKKGSNVP